jgi:Raf kinase inhibitor-like YbhB/YbcL family protein
MNISRHAVLGTILFLSSTPLVTQTAAKTSVTGPPSRNSMTFTLSSSDVKNGVLTEAQVLNTFGCSGGNVSPQLSWANAPAGTKSFVLTMFDPDAPTGSGFWHWVVVNIPSSAGELPNGASGSATKLPAGTLETRTDLGAPGYGGPCPPAGNKPHRYIFTLHALKVEKLDVDVQTSAALIGFNVHMQEIARATLTARYGR